MIGKDFDKIPFSMFGLELLEPMGILLDLVLAFVSFYFVYKISKFSLKDVFYTSWMYFFLFFGLATFLGALGHGLFNYFGVFGMFPSWLLVPVAIFFIEMAVISAYNNEKGRALMKRIYRVKLVTVYLAFGIIYFSCPVFEKPSLLFLPIAINTILGLIITLGVFGVKLTKNGSVNFKYLVIGVLVIFPSAIIFLMKINIHPWFNKNDFSHLLMIGGLVCFYTAVSKLQEEKMETSL